MAKKLILAIVLLILIVIGAFVLFDENTVDVYIDGENVSVETHTLSDIDNEKLSSDICDLTVKAMNDTSTDVSALKNNIESLCREYGLDDAEVSIDSSIGPDQIPVIIYVDGTSMVPTLQDGQTVLMNKTHDVHVGDIVVAESDEYGGIIKRVDEINGNDIHLVSDNKEISYEQINGVLYEIKGISTWVDISDINGVVIAY